MKLFYNTNSPYSRKCRIVILEKGLQDRVELVESMPPHLSEALLAANPLGRIPALVTDAGRLLCESPVICEYLDGLSLQNPLFPTDKEAKIEALRIAALASGIMDSAVACVMEGRRPEEKQWRDWVERKENAVKRTIKFLAIEDIGVTFDIGALSVAVALAYVSYRLPHIAWQAEHPTLAAWLENANKRPSMLATAPVAT